MLASVVLLAGNSKRMGEPKQHVKIAGKTFLELIIEKLMANRKNLSEMVFVGQKFDFLSQKIVDDVKGKWINNPNPENGPLSSIRLAVVALPENSSILLWPTDHPMVKTVTIEKLIAEWMLKPNLITVPSDGERRGHPSIFPEWACNEFFRIELTAGARQVMMNNPEKINHVFTADPWIRSNLNTPETLKALSLN